MVMVSLAHWIIGLFRTAFLVLRSAAGDQPRRKPARELDGNPLETLA
jgi:hypothetical protein